MISPLDRARYAVNQSARVAWFMGHYFATRPFHKREGDASPGRFTPSRETPGSNRMLSDLAELSGATSRTRSAGSILCPAIMTAALSHF